MIYTVQFTRYFEEFGFNDCDKKDFDNLKDAWAFYNEKKENKDDRYVQLWVKKEGEAYGTRLH